MTYTYALHGLNFNLPFPCPFLPLVETDAAPDVTVAYGEVPRELSGAEASDDSWKTGFCWQAAPGRYLLRGGMKSGRFLAQGGNRVTLHLNEKAVDERVLTHSVAAALLRQRGFLVLHASTANTQRGAIALCGQSQAGKSTTLAAMLKSGCEMVSDDITILRLDGNGRVEVVPGTAMMHLWEDAAQGVGLDVSGFDRHPMRRGKAAVSASGLPCIEPVPLGSLCILEPCGVEHPVIVPVAGADKLDALMKCVYGPLFPEEHPALFTLFSTTAGQTDIFRLQRPESGWTVDKVTDLILNG
jgi:hypothetical protein